MAIEQHPDNQYDFEPQPNKMELNPIGFGRELYARAAQGLGLSPFTNDPEPARIPVAESPTEGGRSIGDYLPSGEQARDGLHRFFLGLEGLGSGYQGREPLYMRERRQLADEQDHLMQRQVQLGQMQQQKKQQSWDAYYKAEQITDPKTRKALSEQWKKSEDPMVRFQGELLGIIKEPGAVGALAKHLEKAEPEVAAIINSEIEAGTMTADKAKFYVDTYGPVVKDVAALEMKASQLEQLKKVKNPGPATLNVIAQLEAEAQKAQEEQKGRQLGNQGKEQELQHSQAKFPGELATTNANAQVAQNNIPKSAADTATAQAHAKVAKATIPGQIAKGSELPRRELPTDTEGGFQVQELQPNGVWTTIGVGKKKAGVEVNLGPAAQKDRAEGLASLRTLNDVLTNWKPKYTGPADSWIGAIKSTLGFISQPEADWRSSVALLRAQLRKFYYGTAQSKTELAGGIEALPSADLGDQAFPASIEANKKKVRQMLQAQEAVRQEQLIKGKPSAADRYKFLTTTLGADEKLAHEIMSDEGY
jgi:hypothetical protein